MVLKHEPLLEELIRLSMSTEISKELKDYLEQKYLYKTILHQETFKHVHASQHSKVEVGVMFAYQS
jgi:hypothetical protein